MIDIPNYNVIKKIGEGGMGVVYLAVHKILGRKVAIKCLHDNLTLTKKLILRFRREARLLAQLDHPNVVRLYDYFEQNGRFYLIMEYTEGLDLNLYLKKINGPISEKKLISLFSKILEGVGYAHNQGLVHRDIKPSNIIITKEGGVKILDFGVAKLITENKDLTKTGAQIGTVRYMSPEQVKAKRVDKLSDIYSLGVTLFQMATCCIPYKSTSSFDTQLQILNEPFPRAKEFYPGVSDKIEEVINKATQKKKTDRYQNCEDFLEALQLEDLEETLFKDSGEKLYNDSENIFPKTKNNKRSSFFSSAFLKVTLIIAFSSLIIVGFFFMMSKENGSLVVTQKNKTEKIENQGDSEQEEGDNVSSKNIENSRKSRKEKDRKKNEKIALEEFESRDRNWDAYWYKYSGASYKEGLAWILYKTSNGEKLIERYNLESYNSQKGKGDYFHLPKIKVLYIRKGTKTKIDLRRKIWK